MDENSIEVLEEKQYPEPPDGIRVLKNGAGYDMVTKRIAYPPGTFGDAPNQITKDNARDMVMRRHQLTKDKINSAIVEQARKRGVNVQTPQEAIGHAAGVLFGEVLKGKGTLRDRNKVLWDIAKYSGNIETLDNSSTTTQAVQINITLDAIRNILSRT